MSVMNIVIKNRTVETKVRPIIIGTSNTPIAS
jgi:hypothetical protein